MNSYPYWIGVGTTVVLCALALFLVWYDRDPPDDGGNDYWGV